MGGCSMHDDEEFTSPLTLVLLGRTGNGKSATGNSIIGSMNFESKHSSSGVTTTSELETSILEDGRMLNVIDTPGLFDSSIDTEFIKKEIVGCIDMAKDGIHAFLVVFSVCGRFSDEEKAVFSCLVTLFGPKIYDYIIVVFTGGDELEEDGKTLGDFLSNSSETLKEILSSCGNRYVLFNNRTKDKTKKAKQLQQLLYYVSMVLAKNGEAFKKVDMEEVEQDLTLKETKQHSKQEMLELKRRIIEMCVISSVMIGLWVWLLSHFSQRGETVVLASCGDSMVSCVGILAAVLVFFQLESKFMEINTRLEQKLEEERTARLKAEINGKQEQKKSKEMIYKLLKQEQKKSKEMIDKLLKELKTTKEAANRQCVIM